MHWNIIDTTKKCLHQRQQQLKQQQQQQEEAAAAGGSSSRQAAAAASTRQAAGKQQASSNRVCPRERTFAPSKEWSNISFKNQLNTKIELFPAHGPKTMKSLNKKKLWCQTSTFSRRTASRYDLTLALVSGWWFQPLWKILVSWDYHSQYMEK